MTGTRASRTARRGAPGWRGAAIVVAAAMLALSLAGIAAAVDRPGPGTAGGGAQISRAAGVRIEGFAYHPSTLRIAKGTTVTFANASKTAHTATRGGSFTTGRIKPGRSVAIRFAQRGAFAYHCTIHPFMHGKIVVG